MNFYCELLTGVDVELYTELIPNLYRTIELSGFRSIWLIENLHQRFTPTFYTDVLQGHFTGTFYIFK
jgi:hypothetical protein